MDRPEKRNALSGEMVEQLTAAFSEASSDLSVRVIVLTGTGSAFSAGADLAALQGLQSASLADNLADSTRLAALFDAIDSAPKPVVARVNGHAIAGGCGLQAVCDFSLAADTARLGFTEVRIGFVPAIVSVFLRSRLGEGKLRDLLLTGRLISAPEAESMGLIHRSVPNDALDAAVKDLALLLVRETSGQAIAETKALLRDLRSLSHPKALEAAVASNARARALPDCRAGVAAFLQKEAPPWRRQFDAEEGN
jgi:methylglutaconyl-CoA hydratase